MLVDSSALIALIEHEAAAEQVATVLASAHHPAISAATLTETLIVLTARYGPLARTVFDRLNTEIKLDIVDYTSEHAYAAQRASPASATAATPPDLTTATASTTPAPK